MPDRHTTAAAAVSASEMISEAGATRLTMRDGWTHLVAHGLHVDTARALGLMMEKMRRADTEADRAADVERVRRARQLRKPIVVATADTPRLNLTLVARPRPAARRRRRKDR